MLHPDPEVNARMMAVKLRERDQERARTVPLMKLVETVTGPEAFTEPVAASTPKPKKNEAQPDGAAPIAVKLWPTLDLEALDEREPERPQFILSDWLPAGYASLIAGHGGVGKSALALYLSVCIAKGVPFFGAEVARRRVMYLSCEDRENVLHWRLDRICAHLGASLANLRGWLEVVDLVGKDSILWERDPRTGYTVTPAYATLCEQVKAHGTELLVVDGVSDTYGGNENSRPEVKRFINSLLALIPADRGAVLLVGHVAKPTAANGSTTEGYSGSTAWHNSVRARWYLRPEKADDDDDGIRSGALVLELQKSNFCRRNHEPWPGQFPCRALWQDTRTASPRAGTGTGSRGTVALVDRYR
jgi:RecA-family ATPase